MKQFKKKNTQKFWHSPLALVVLFGIFMVFAYNMVGLVKKERETSKNKAAELSKIDELHNRESILMKDIAKLETEEGVEASIRDKFQVVKPGEKEVLIVHEQEKINSEQGIIDHSFWGFIKRMFSKGR